MELLNRNHGVLGLSPGHGKHIGGEFNRKPKRENWRIEREEILIIWTGGRTGVGADRGRAEFR